MDNPTFSILTATYYCKYISNRQKTTCQDNGIKEASLHHHQTAQTGEIAGVGVPQHRRRHDIALAQHLRMVETNLSD